MDMGFWPDVRRIVAGAARLRRAADAALLGDDAGRSDEAGRRSRARRRSSCRSDRPAVRPRASRTPSRTWPRREKTEWLAKFLRRTDGPVLVFVRTKSGAERLARKLASLRPEGRGAARRSHAAAAHAGGRRLPQRQLPRAGRHRRRRARPRHRRHHARRELRSAVEPRDLRAPRRTHRPRRRHRHRAHARRARGAARAAGAPALVRARSCRDDGRYRIQFAPAPALPAARTPADVAEPGRRARRPAASAGRAPERTAPLVARGREVQVVPLARDARSRAILHAPRRAAVCRQGRLQPESWCPECAFYKLRRTPKKRERDDYM